MIVVKVELHSAVSGEVTTLGTMVIDNVTAKEKHIETLGRRGDYRARVWQRGIELLDLSYGKGKKPLRTGKVFDHPRLSLPIWSLVLKSLRSMGYKG